MKNKNKQNQRPDIYDKDVEFREEYEKLRNHYGANLVLADIDTAWRLKHARWPAQGSPDLQTRIAATKDVFRSQFTLEVFYALETYHTAKEVIYKVGTFKKWQRHYLSTFGQIMGDIPYRLKRLGEWSIRELEYDE